MHFFKKKSKPAVDPDKPAPVPPQETARKPAETAAPALEDKEVKRSRFMSRLKKGLAKTRDILTTDVDDLLAGGKKVDADTLEELEEILISADIGVEITMGLLERIGQDHFKIATTRELKKLLQQEM